MKKRIKSLYSKLHTTIYRWLLNHPYCDARVNVFRKRKNSQFLRMVAGRDDMSFSCDSKGTLNRGVNIYKISMGSERVGMFALVRELLKYLSYADRFSFAPVVEWVRSVPYAEKYLFKGTMNPFEYYWEQPSGISIEDTNNSYNVFESKEVHVANSFLNREIADSENGYWMSEELIERLGLIARKYLHFRADIQEYLDEKLEELLGGYSPNKEAEVGMILGVHYRGTDYKVGYNNHPVLIPVQRYFDEIDKLIQEERIKRIFLATDDKEILDLFLDKYGDKIVYQNDVSRVAGEESVAFSENERKNHKYLLGLEVLSDMYILSKCDCLISGISQVSLAARIWKRSYGDKYCRDIMLNDGFNRNMKVFVR